MKVSVLGIEYTVLEVSKDEDPKLEKIDGYCDTSTKICVVDAMTDSDVMDKGNLKEYKKEVVRHELIHAFLYESGLDKCSQWACNEELVDWIAIQFPKLLKAFMEVESL